MDNREAEELIRKNLIFVKEALKNCEEIADKYGLDFRLNPAYGMGGTYVGTGDREFNESGMSKDGYHESEMGWQASSMSC